jgi:hypothetical protein
MDGNWAASAGGSASLSPNKNNSKGGVDEGGQTRESRSGLVGYAPPLNTIGNTGEPRLTRSKSNPYHLWQGLGDDHDSRKRAAPVTGGTMELQTIEDEVDDYRGEEEENDASHEESDSAHSPEKHHSVNEEHRGEASLGDQFHGDDAPDDFKFRESTPIDSGDFSLRCSPRLLGRR